MARLATPGVYVRENNAFSSSVVEAQSAIPAFIGYTAKAERGHESLLNTPTRIDSYKEFINFFGKGPLRAENTTRSRQVIGRTTP